MSNTDRFGFVHLPMPIQPDSPRVLVQLLHALRALARTDWARDGLGSLASATIATVFYAGPLIVAAGFGIGLPSGRAPIAAEIQGAEDGDGDEALELDGTQVVRFVALPEAPPAPPGDADTEPELAPAAPAPKAARATSLASAAGTPVDGIADDGDVAAVGEGEGEGDGGDGTAATGEAGTGPARGEGRVSRARKLKICENPHPNIRMGADGVVEIDRELVEKYTKSISTFMSLGVSRPFGDDGLKGWYISGFSCTSPVHKAGFRRGDVLLSVNGKNTRTLVGVYMLYQKLKNRSEFEVQLVRRGEPVTLHLRIVDG